MREGMTNLLKKHFLFDGFDFKQGFIYRINGSGLKLPCLWLNPVELIGSEGRRDRRSTYRIVLYLFIQNENYSEEDKEVHWGRLESMAVSAAASIIPEVANLSGLKCTPDEFAYTGFGELSMKVEFTAEIFDCYEDTE